ncbi:MAG: UbiD family decarboxylase [Chloroflexi bacterium]|nr:UbiD family decarboxylase [Chloroflexota bacterium]
MLFRDLRGFIARLEEEGEIQRIEKEVDWNLEVGAIIRRTYDLKSPAPFFQKLKDYPRGYSILGAPLGTSGKPNQYHARLAISLDLPPDSSVMDIMESYILRKKNPVKPVLISSGPCQENIHLNEDVDVGEFPAPLLHEGDGGRYIGTWHLVATRDPDSGWVNWGMYRLMIHDNRSTGIDLHPYQHIGLHYAKYEARNKPMEFAVAMGTEPVTPLVAAGSYSPGVDEVDIAGSLRGEPLELVKCLTVDLAVPATSEIVLEGEIRPYERMEEGPFGEFTGYRASERAPRPVCRIKAITHRHNPILPVCCHGVPVDDSHARRPLVAADLLDYLRSKGFPINMVYAPPEVSPLLYILSTRVPFANYAKHLAFALWGSPGGKTAPYVIIVDDDVDITNIDEVVWALTTRCHPERGITKILNTMGTPLLPFLDSYEKKHHIGAQVLLDCTWPKEWPPEAIPVKASFDALWPKETQEKVLKNWTEYGYRT